MSKRKVKEEALELYRLGKIAYEAGKEDDAYSNLHKAYNFLKHSSEEAMLADILRILGEILFNKGNYIESRNFYKKADLAFKGCGHRIGMADSYDQVALSFMLQSEYEHAEDYQQKALKIRKKTADKKGLARGLKNLAVIVYRKDDDVEKLLAILEEALEFAEKGKDPQLLINIALDRSKILTKKGDYDEAMKNFIIARRFSKKYSITLPDEHEEEFADLLLNIGLKKYDMGDFEEAIKYLKNSVLIYKSRNNPIQDSIENTINKIEELISNREN